MSARNSGALLLGGPVVRIPVARDLVPRTGDAANEIGIALGDPSQREKRCPHVGLREKFKNPLDVALHPARQRVPIAARDVLRKRRNLKIVFDVDA